MPQTKLGAGIELEAKDNASPAIGRVGTSLGNLGMMFSNFGASAGRFSPAMAGAAQGLGSMGTGAAGMMGSMGKMGAMLPVIGAVVAGLAIGIGKLNEMAERATQVITTAIDAFAQYERSLLEVQTIVRGTADEMRMLGDTAVSMSTQFGTTATAQLKGFYQAASAGFSSYDDATQVMDTANKLAVAGVADITGSIGLLAGSIKSYGMEAGDAGRISDILFKTVEKGVTTIPELAANMAKVSPVAAISGVSLEQVAAAMAAITTTGMPTSQATTSLAGLFRSLTKITPEVEKAFAKYGIELDAARLKNEGLLPILEDIKRATGGNVGALRELIREEEGFKAAAILTGGQLGYYKESLEAMNTAQGATQVAFDAMSGSIDFQRRRWASFKDSIAIALGETFAPLMHAALGILDKFISAIDELPKPIKSALLALTGIGLALPAVGGKVMSLVWSTVKLGLAFGVIYTGLFMLGPMLVPLAIAVTGLAGAFSILGYTLIKKVLPGGEGLVSQLKKISFALRAAYAFIGKGELSGALADEFLTMDEGTRQLSLKMVAAWDMIKIVFSTAKEVVVSALDAMADQFGPGLNRVTDWIKGMLSGKSTAKEFAASIPIEDLKAFGEKAGDVLVKILKIGEAFIYAGIHARNFCLWVNESWNEYVKPILGAMEWVWKVGRTMGPGGMLQYYPHEGEGGAQPSSPITSMPSSVNQVVREPPVHERASSRGGEASVKANIHMVNQSTVKIDNKVLGEIITEKMEEWQEDNLEGPLEMSFMTS